MKFKNKNKIVQYIVRTKKKKKKATFPAKKTHIHTSNQKSDYTEPTVILVVQSSLVFFIHFLGASVEVGSNNSGPIL